jgi:hypothetical protein
MEHLKTIEIKHHCESRMNGIRNDGEVFRGVLK